MKREQIKQMMQINIEDTKTLLDIATECKDADTKSALYQMIGVYQQRWEDLYNLSWK